MRLAPPSSRPVTPDTSWRIVLEASAAAARLDRDGRPAAFGLGTGRALVEVDDGAAGAVMAWVPGTGWQSRLPAGDPRAEFLDLYLPLCSATAARPLTLGHLGQSLDGFIATETGDSQFVTGSGNLQHMHCLRALCDAVVVGAGTVAADDPRLTTRLVEGPNPLRVVFDPARRVGPAARVFTDGAAPTLYACERSRVGPGETRVGHAEILPVGEGDDAARDLVAALRARGCARVFVEGGGVTVSTFLEAGLLDRLQIAVAPVLIGRGRPAVRLAPRASLSDCRRPAYRVFRMGGDVLFDCDLRARSSADGDARDGAPTVTRVI
ncbi:MAG: RibD family protein [Vicinamibacterales bacterium]